MTRIVTRSGVVHFRNPANRDQTLCGVSACETVRELFGIEHEPLRETRERVNCPQCARVVCAIRNEPYNTLEDGIETDALMTGIFAAAEPDAPANAGGAVC